jgi:hypothetical protein
MRGLRSAPFYRDLGALAAKTAGTTELAHGGAYVRAAYNPGGTVSFVLTRAGRGSMHPIALIVIGVFTTASAVFWAIALTDVAKRAEWEFPPHPAGSNARALWTLVVLVGNVFGSLAYYVTVMRPYPRDRR